MGAKPVELILLRQLARRMPCRWCSSTPTASSSISTPPPRGCSATTGTNTGELPITELAELGDLRDLDNNPLSLERIPIAMALHERRPQQGTLIVHDVDGRPHRIVTTNIPLDGQGGGALLGAMSIFWEEEEEEDSDA